MRGIIGVMHYHPLVRLPVLAERFYLVLIGRVLDPIAAVTVSFFIMRVSIRLLVPCLDELLEKSLPDSVEREIEGIVLSFDGVSEPHHLRTRRIGNNYAIEIHIRMNGNISLHKAHETATGIEHRLKEKFGEDTHVGIHVEPVK